MEDLIDTLTDLQQRVSATIEEVVRRARLRTASDAELADAVARAGGIARSVDALLVESVGELADRSRSVDRAERLTTRMGCRDVGELVQRLIRCSSHTARQLGSAQRAVALEWDPIPGEARPAMLPAMRAALLRGDVGVDGVLAAAGPLLAMRDRVDRGRLMLADEAVAAQARGDGPDGAPPACADLLRVHAQVWAIMLDEDGAEPTDRQRAARRGLTLGRPRDGMTPIRGDLLPEVAAQLRRIFDAMGSPRATGVRFRAEGDEAVVQDPDAADGRFLDDRSRPQRQHDALATALAAAAASRELPTIGGAAPTLVVSVREEDLAGSRGWAHAEGADDPVSLAAARHTGCAGVVQRVSRDARGRIRRLGSEERVFNRYQRRAIALRDGGCIIPGCGTPAAWCEIHHVIDHAKGGATHTDNGVLLCWFHHRFIDTGPWRVRMNRGVPEVQAPPWFDRSGRWRPVTTSRTRMLDLIGRRT